MPITASEFEKCDYHLIKAELGLNFTMKCKLFNVISTILLFSQANKSWQNSLTCQQCLLNLLNDKNWYSKVSHINSDTGN